MTQPHAERLIGNDNVAGNSGRGSCRLSAQVFDMLLGALGAIN